MMIEYEALGDVVESLAVDDLNDRELADMCDDLNESVLEMRKRLAEYTAAQAAVVDKALHRWGDKERALVPGVGWLRVKPRPGRVEWQHEDLVRALRRSAVEKRQPDPETGVIESVDAAHLRALLACAQISGWRVEAAADWEIDVTLFSKPATGHKVEVRRREGA